MAHSKLPASGGAHSRHHVNLRIERWNRRSTYASVLLLLLSGAVWLIARHFLRPASQFGESVHPLEPLAMKVHGAGTMAMLFFLGSLMNSHIRRAVKARRNLASGWAMIMTMAVLVMTGFGLYYLAGEASRPIWSTIHWTIGLVLAGLIVAHVLIGRASR